MATKRRTYRVNADSWTTLMDILVGTPEEFNTDRASIRGRTLDSNMRPSFGRVPDEYSLDIFNARYVIYSYGTPIAWRDRRGEWTVPDVRYSVTTSKHQGKVRAALSNV